LKFHFEGPPGPNGAEGPPGPQGKNNRKPITLFIYY